ncbi:MAG: nucleoside monophosphate kinase [Patescibacteria group bacterium]
MILVFLGPPYSGKGIQAELLSKQLKIPVFSMGLLIRRAYENKDPKIVKGYKQYALKGMHLPNKLKSHLLKKKLDENKGNFILDNYPATKEDLDEFLNYLSKHFLQVDKVFYINISISEMKKRIVDRQRKDDKFDIVLKRRHIQDKDRIPVLAYFNSKGLLKEINGEGSIEDVYERIVKVL